VLDIYGVGDQTPYRHLFQELGIDDRRCHMYDSLTDVQNAYLNSSIFVLPSRFEGFSLVVIEAMSCGVPVVSFDCPHGPRNIIKNGEDGILIEPLNFQALADGICKLIEDKGLRMQLGTNARKNVLRFSQDSIMEQWDNLFKLLIV
jgi:glycosyltransferase involved in cell wall biosynthesis